MARSFSSPEKQAEKAISKMDINSLGTQRDYEQALTRAAEYLSEYENNAALSHITVEQAEKFLEIRSEEIGQKTLDMERHALQAFLNTQGKLEGKLDFVVSSQQQILESRAYSQEQIAEIKAHQQEPNALATEIAAYTGLRAHELFTINTPNNQPPSDRRDQKGEPLPSKFLGKEGITYTVKGKGGLVREVKLRKDLAQRLEARKFDTPKITRDREICYSQKYDIAGGKNWSSSFSKAAARSLGFSNGAHGLRHSYAQERMDYLQKTILLDRDTALKTVSQELGHFRADITEIYLR